MYSVHIGGIMASMNWANGFIADLPVLRLHALGGLWDTIPAGTMLTVGGIIFIVTVLVSWWLMTLRSIYKTGLPTALLPKEDSE